MTEALTVQKVAYILASLCEGEWFSYLFSVLRKNQLQFRKNRKIQKNFSITLFAQKMSEQKNIDVLFSLKRSLQKPRKITETINPIFGPGHEI